MPIFGLASLEMCSFDSRYRSNKDASIEQSCTSSHVQGSVFRPSHYATGIDDNYPGGHEDPLIMCQRLTYSPVLRV